MRVVHSLRETVIAIARCLREPRIYVALVLAVIVWSLAYQQKATYTVDIGGPGDDAYVSGFNAKEHNESLDYRWSGSVSTVRFPGIGNEPVYLTLRTVGFRPSGLAPRVTVRARGQEFNFPAQSAPHEDTFFLPVGDRFQTDLTVEILAPTFSPQGDPRRLGVIVDRVSVSPASSGLRPLVTPPPATILGLALSIFLFYLTVSGTLRSQSLGLLLIYAMGVTFACLVLLARPELGLLAEGAPAVSLWSLGLGILGRTIVDGLHVPSPAAGWGSLAFAVGFALRFGGMLYPQFLTSDIVLHVHNLQSVLHGQWLFTEPLPDGTPVPYPNAFYVLLSPLAGLLGASDATLSMLLKWSGSALDAATCLALAWAGARLWGARTGAFAAGTYAISPAVFELLSAGNYTNVFAQAVLNVTLLVGLVYLAGRSRLPGEWLGPALLAVGFALTMLGHYGMMLATLAVASFFVVWAVWLSWRRAVDAPRAWVVVGAAAAGLVFSFAAYYRHFTSEMAAQWSGLYQRLAGAKPGRQVTAASSSGGVADFVARRSVLVSPLLAITAASSSLLGLRARESAKPTAPAYAGLLGAWLAAALLFAALDQIVGDTVRWAYLGAAVIALLGGRFFAVLLPAGGAARLLICLAVAAVVWYTLLYWVGDLIFTHYH